MTEQKKLAVVDDDDVFHWIIQKHIERIDLPIEVLSFYNGDEIFDFVADVDKVLPDIVFLDLNMPICNGWGFLDRFSKIHPQMQNGMEIYIVSSSIDPEDINRAENYEFVKDFVSKPLTEEFIRSVIEG